MRTGGDFIAMLRKNVASACLHLPVAYFYFLYGSQPHQSRLITTLSICSLPPLRLVTTKAWIGNCCLACLVGRCRVIIAGRPLLRCAPCAQVPGRPVTWSSPPGSGLPIPQSYASQQPSNTMSLPLPLAKSCEWHGSCPSVPTPPFAASLPLTLAVSRPHPSSLPLQPVEAMAQMAKS